MSRQTPGVTLSALVLALTAGTCAPAYAQKSDSTTRPNTTAADRDTQTDGRIRPEGQDSASTESKIDFRSSEWLSARDVVNSGGDTVGTVSDLILDRGTGKIEYLVVKAKPVEGAIPRSVALPFSLFGREAGNDHFVLTSTETDLKQSPEFTGQAWKELMESDGEEAGRSDSRGLTNSQARNDRTDASRTGTPAEVEKADPSNNQWRKGDDNLRRSDPYAGNLGGGVRTRVEGEVTSVERVRTSSYGEQVVVTVKTADGGTKKVALGPSWYVNGSAAAPVRGDRITAETLSVPNDADQTLAGTHFRTGQGELSLRGEDGNPVWSGRARDRAEKNYSAPRSRYLLASALRGMKVDCLGSEVGRVNEIILDRSSGEAAFVSVDPNRNFLGTNDAKILVPWSVTTALLDGSMRVDASKEMIQASAQTPADISSLNIATVSDRVYKPYGVAAHRFETAARAYGDGDASSSWSANGPIIAAIDRGSSKRFEGDIVEVTEVSFQSDVQPAKAVKIRSAGDGKRDQLVLLGPVKYMQGRGSAYHAGDSVKVEAVRTKIDGREYWLAKSVDHKDQRTVLIDGDTPAWNQQ